MVFAQLIVGQSPGVIGGRQFRVQLYSQIEVLDPLPVLFQVYVDVSLIDVWPTPVGIDLDDPVVVLDRTVVFTELEVRIAPVDIR